VLSRIITSPADLAAPNLLQRIGHLIVGESRQRFARPQAVAVQGDDRLYVADQKLQGIHVLHWNSSSGEFISRAGSEFFKSPVGLAVCRESLAVSDSALRAVFILSLDGRLQRKLEKPGGFQRPTGLAFSEADGLIYVVDTLANEVCAFDLSGRLVRRFGSQGSDPGQFNYPTYICVDRKGMLYVTDSMNFRVQAFDNEGRYQFEIGKLGDSSGHLAVPKGVGVTEQGHIYVVDSYFSNVQVFDRTGTFLIAVGEPGDGPGAFQVPTGLSVDSTGRVLVCDSYNSRVQVFRYVGQDDEQAPVGH
jgi:DNA-binding beta-propeller fold protein YncE